MKRKLGIIMIGALLAGTVITACAKTEREKKNEPKNRNAVADALKAAGEEHFPEKMKVRDIGSIKMENTYYHIYSGTLKEGGYHAIVFDNKPEYLGYYFIAEYEPSGYEDGGSKEGYILIDLGSGGDEERIRIKQDGPVDQATIDGVKSYFVKAPEKKVKAFEKPKEEGGSEDSLEPIFREWTIAHDGKKLKVRAIYVSQTFGKVTLRGEATGRENAFPISSISKEDQEYIKLYK